MIKPLTPATFAEYLDLLQGVLPGRRVERLQHRMRRVRIEFSENAHDLFELRISSALFCSRPAVSMISTSRLLLAGTLERLVGKPGRIGAELRRRFRISSVRPDLQLLDRRRRKVSRRPA